MAAEPKTTAAGDDDNLLLPELWREILTRLPVKSNLQCRSVCKSWHSLISCPNFIDHYSIRNLNKNGNHILLQLYDPETEVYSYSSYVESFMECREHDDIPEPFFIKGAYIVGSCNGLICLSKCCPMKDDNSVSVITFLIWNPTIRKIIELPPRTYCSSTEKPSYYGFGFDSKTNDYKVLCVVAYLGEKCDEFYEKITYVCEVFDLKKGVWRTIDPMIHPSWGIVPPRPECYLNGFAHWYTYYRPTNKLKIGKLDRIILSFDMTDELFRLITLPSGAYMSGGHLKIRMVTFNGLIYLILADNRTGEEVSCSFWVMKEYGVAESWTKVFNINRKIARGLPNTSLWPDLFHLWGNNEVLMVHVLDEYADGEDPKYKPDLVLYNIESRTLKHLFSSTKLICDPCFYKESLVLMRGQQEINKRLCR